MPNIPLYMAGQVGIVKDVEPHELTPLAWSDGRNIKFRDGRIVRAFGDLQVFGTPLAAPYWVMPVQNITQALWIYSSLTKLYATNGGTHAEITRAVGGDYTVDNGRLWNGGILSQIPVITNGSDVPQAWLAPDLLTNFENLPNWPAADRCLVIKPFKSFLIAMVIIRGGNTFGHLVKWSHPAVPGAVPVTWDPTDATKLAGEVEIPDGKPGIIRDGGGLRDTFVIYKDNTTWGCQFIGGNSVFRFYPIFLQSGILSNSCFVEINNGAMHFVATGDDIIVHDGQSARSVLSRKLRTFIRNNLAPTQSNRSFCTVKQREKEAWFCFAEEGNSTPNLAVVYNYEEDTSTLKDLPAGTNFADAGPLGGTTDAWDDDAAAWDTDTSNWDDLLFSPHFSELLSANPTLTQLIQLENSTVYATARVERTGLALVGQDRLTGEFKVDNFSRKLIRRIWIKAKGVPFKVRLGGQDTLETAVVWEAFQTFTPGVDKYKDFIVNARHIAVEFDSDGDGVYEIEGYDLETEVISNL